MAYTLDSLVDDIIIEILKILSVTDIFSIRLTSKRLETLSRLLHVWTSTFRREVIDGGRPAPGYSIPHCDLLLSTYDSGSYSEVEQRISGPGELNSLDLETRTLLAIRLEKRWSRSGTSTPESGHTAPPNAMAIPTSQNVLDLFLVPGGRYLAVLHGDRLHVWDIGFPCQTFGLKALEATRVAEFVFMTSQEAGSEISVTADSKMSICRESQPLYRFAYTRQNDPSARAPKLVSVLALNLDELKSRGRERWGSGTPTTTAFIQEKEIALPGFMPPPIGLCESTLTGNGRDRNTANEDFGTLGRLIYMFSTWLAFESFAPPLPNISSESLDDVTLQYVGIELLDWTSADAALNSSLLMHPGIQCGEYLAMHIQECSSHVVVVWSRCIGVYPLRPLAEFPNETSGRLVIYPVILFALMEEIEKPVAFTPCLANPHPGRPPAAQLTVPSYDGVENLTIVAQPVNRPGGIAQRLLTYFAVLAMDSRQFSLKKPYHYDYHFRLTNIPGRDMQSTGFTSPMAALALAPSGRGLRADRDGALYKCAASRMLIPFLRTTKGTMTRMNRQTDPSVEGQDEMSGDLVDSVDFWPYRRVGTVPSPPVDCRIYDELDAAAVSNLSNTNRQNRPLMRFDDGMGRAVFAYSKANGASHAGHGGTVVTVMDFA